MDRMCYCCGASYRKTGTVGAVAGTYTCSVCKRDARSSRAGEPFLVRFQAAERGQAQVCLGCGWGPDAGGCGASCPNRKAAGPVLIGSILPGIMAELSAKRVVARL